MRVTVAEIAQAGGFEAWHRKVTLEANAHPVKSPVLGGDGCQNGQCIGPAPKNAATGQESGKTGLSEHDEQTSLIARVKAMEPTIQALRLLHAIPNGGHRNKATAGKLKAEGVRRGVPDLCLPVPTGGFHGLYVEMKAQGGKASPEQLKWQEALRANGYCVEICVGADEAWNVICDYLGVRT